MATTLVLSPNTVAVADLCGRAAAEGGAVASKKKPQLILHPSSVETCSIPDEDGLRDSGGHHHLEDRYSGHQHREDDDDDDDDDETGKDLREEYESKKKNKKNNKKKNHDDDDGDDESSSSASSSSSSSSSSESPTYLSLDASGMVVRSISTAAAVVVSEDDNGSVASVPRTALPPHQPPAAERRSLLRLATSSDDEDDDEDVEDYDSFLPPPNDNDATAAAASFLLEPPDAADYAPAEWAATRSEPPASAPTPNPPGAVVLDLTTEDRDRFRAEEEATATRLLAGGGSLEAPPPPPKTRSSTSRRDQQQRRQPADPVLPPNHYSHLLRAYEVERDPSRILPPKEFVASPTDETRRNRSADDDDRVNNSSSPDTSYEDDIEVGSPAAAAAASSGDEEEGVAEAATARSRSRRKGAVAGLFTIFSPRPGPSPEQRRRANGAEASASTTPETQASEDSPHRKPGEFRGKQLFVRGRTTPASKPMEEGRLGIADASFDASAGQTDAGVFDGKRNRPDIEKSSSSSNRKKRSLCFALMVGLGLLLAAAVAVIAYAMYSEYQKNQRGVTTDADAILLDGPPRPVPPDNVVVVIEIANRTETEGSDRDGDGDGDAEEGGFEWMTTTAPFFPANASELRPVTLKQPTGEPTASPTLAPTVTGEPTTRVPTGRPTTGTPTPTVRPTVAPTRSPTTEGERGLAGRLQELLRSRNFPGANGRPFAFDVSTAAAIDDPSNRALVYLAREVAAVASLPPVEEEDRSDEPDRKDELGTVVVTVGGSDPLAYDPNFLPIDLLAYDDEKLLQRFALLALQHGAGWTSENSSNDDNDNGNDVAAAPKRTRVVLPDEDLEEAIEAGRASTATTTSTTAAKPYVDPASLADPDDDRFLVDECDWEGVTCVSNDNATSTIVSAIRWDDRDLSGSIPSDALGLLAALTSLDVSGNRLSGPIPEDLYDLTNLEEVYLFRNELTGTLSSKIGNLGKIRRWHASHNRLTGTLPSELQSDDNSVNGIRPVEYFNVYDNRLTGTLPSDLRWRRCVYLDVGRNDLTGTLPPDLGEKLVSLRHLHLDRNAFTGTLPSTYNEAGNGRLVSLAIESNKLTGVVPGDRSNFEVLVRYTLQDNDFDAVDPLTCRNRILVEYKADCDVCNCYGRFFDFCDRWCGGDENYNNNNNGGGGGEWWWGQQPQRPPPPPPQNWQQQRPPPPRNWSF